MRMTYLKMKIVISLGRAVHRCRQQGSHWDWKTWENGKAFSSQGKGQGILNRLEKSGKIIQNTGKLREFEINII